MKKKHKIITIVILTIAILSLYITISYGFGIENLTGDQTDLNTTNALTNAGNGIVKMLTTIGTVLSVVMLIVIGIKYMIGSTEEKAEYKKSLMPYVIGAGLVFIASVIAQLIYDVAIQL